MLLSVNRNRSALRNCAGQTAKAYGLLLHKTPARCVNRLAVTINPMPPVFDRIHPSRIRVCCDFELQKKASAVAKNTYRHLYGVTVKRKPFCEHPGEICRSNSTKTFIEKGYKSVLGNETEIKNQTELRVGNHPKWALLYDSCSEMQGKGHERNGPRPCTRTAHS